jgi:alanine racemase
VLLSHPFFNEPRQLQVLASQEERQKLKSLNLAITEFKEGLKRLGLSDEEASAELERLQSAGVLPTVGQSLPSPAIIVQSAIRKKPTSMK